MTVYKAINVNSDQVVLERLTVCDTCFSRLRGLLGRNGLGDDEGVFLSKVSSVHTLFMRFPIDIVFLDNKNRIVKIVECVKPYHLAFGSLRTSGTLEMACGKIRRDRFLIGDRIVFMENKEKAK